MNLKGHCYGIDIGTRTTVISCYDYRQQTSYEVKVDGDYIIPSSLLDLGRGNYLFGPRAEKAVIDEPGQSSKLLKNFKIDFWVRDPNDPKRTLLAKARLREFLSQIWQYLLKDVGQELDTASFCFTFPAQREQLQREFTELVIEAGFPSNRLRFMDECSAATFGLSWEAAPGDEPALKRQTLWQRLLRPRGSGATPTSPLKTEAIGAGLLIDIGAGTTDVAVVEPGKDIIRVIATRSTNVAGNACTRALATLAQASNTTSRISPAKAWMDFVEAEPSIADRYKEEKLSDEYRDSANRADATEVPVKRRGIKLHANDFSAFRATVEPAWMSIRDCADRAWIDASQDRPHPSWVFLVGGGARHTGLVDLIENTYPGIVRTAKNSRVLTARGAAYYLKQSLSGTPVLEKGARRGTISNVLKDCVGVKFPKDTGAGFVVLFEAGEEVEQTGKPIELKKTVRLKSNVFGTEGAAYLVVGDFRIKLGVIDIDWSVFGESDNHHAIIHVMLDPGSRNLYVSLNMENVKLHKRVHGQVEVVLAARGGFDHVSE